MLFIPKIIWSKNQPIDYDNTQENNFCTIRGQTLFVNKPNY